MSKDHSKEMNTLKMQFSEDMRTLEGAMQKKLKQEAEEKTLQ